MFRLVVLIYVGLTVSMCLAQVIDMYIYIVILLLRHRVTACISGYN